MFIIAKRNYLVRRADGSFYRIEKDYIGEIPEDVAESELVQRAIVGGNIAVPGGTKDRSTSMLPSSFNLVLRTDFLRRILFRSLVPQYSL